ncbi:ATP-binding protein [Nostoc ellipsosporum NOK]|nr:ATP-binding protein [Nostoc ellipsosporum NOK]
MTEDRFLSEVDRQRKYLARLPKNFEFPLFNSKQALKSQRSSGYRNTAAAAREIVDNALEAGAKHIYVAFERPQTLKSYQRKDSITSVAFIDDGAGMLPEMARYALSWGGGTHFDDPSFIGKFGFGLPNASINQTEIVEVYTKTADAKAITKAWLDINEMDQFGPQSIKPPVDADLPDFVKGYMKEHGIKFEHGTVVVWRNPDRLSFRTGAALKEHLVDDFGVTYRYLLKDFELTVETMKVEPVDPLFLDPKGRFYLTPEDGGAQPGQPVAIAVKFFRDRESGTLHLKNVEDADELDENDVDLLATGAINIRVASFPKGFVAGTGKRKAGNTDAHRRFDIRKPRRGLSFVRANREIETVDLFPKTAKEESRGLGQWPLLQSYAYHWAAELRFDPSLDAVFGITHDKQTVRPIEDMWRVLVEKKVDEILRGLNAEQTKTRQKVKKPPEELEKEPSPAEQAAAGALSIAGEKPRIPDREKPAAEKQFETSARERAGVTKESIDKAKAAIAEEAKRRPFRIDFFEDVHAPFFEPRRELGAQIVARINKSHPFYTTFYSRLLLDGDDRARGAVDLVLLALAKGELTVEDETAQEWYAAQRQRQWSPFLQDGLKILERTLHPEDEEAAEEEAARYDGDDGGSDGTADPDLDQAA